MAKYHKHLHYHEDTTKKHILTEEETQFLLELQKEMNIQDTVGNADPRFWVIKGTEKEYGIETGYEDGADLVDDGGCATVATDMESAMIYIRDNVLDEINKTDGVQRNIEMIPGIFHPNIRISWSDDGFEDSVEFDNMEEVADWLREQGYEHSVANYKAISKVYPDTMFLTQKAAEKHLRVNDYHYSDDAHTYAMTAVRSPEVEILWKILREVDWSALLYPKSCEPEYLGENTAIGCRIGRCQCGNIVRSYHDFCFECGNKLEWGNVPDESDSKISRK